MTERELTTKCIAALRSKGAFVAKIHAGPNQPIGLPDIVGCHLGYFFGIEMKVPGKERTLTQRQRQKLTKIRDAGGFAYVCTSKTQVLDVLVAIKMTSEGYYHDRTGGWE